MELSQYVRIDRKYRTGVALVALAVVLAAFGGGYATARATGGTFGMNGMQGRQFGQQGGTGSSRSPRFGGGMLGGEIISVEDGSVTLKAQDGGSRTVYIDSKTQVGKMTTGTAADLAAGVNVSVFGSANADGSITAQSIQIRPAGSPMPGGSRMPNGQ